VIKAEFLQSSLECSCGVRPLGGAVSLHTRWSQTHRQETTEEMISVTTVIREHYGFVFE